MDLKKILDEHLLWLNGKGGSRADLRCANLRNADLREASIDQMMWNIYTVFYPLQCPESGSYMAIKRQVALLWSWKSPQMHAGPPLLAENAAPVRPRY